MCTALTYKTKDYYFGRNLDYEISYGEQVVIMPRRFPFPYRKVAAPQTGYAIIGMAVVMEECPLFFDGTNEKGLSMAGLHFVGNAHYNPMMPEKENVAPYEFIPWVLSQCATIAEVKQLLENLNFVSISFNTKLPLSPLHFMISDRETSIVVEPVKEGLKIYDNPVHVLTNNPAFDMHMMNLNNYLNLTNKQPVNRFSETIPLQTYSRGMGAIGLPGDFSSMSRFVRAAFLRENALSGQGERESVNQFFHMLGNVAHPRGCVEVADGKYEITVYSSCCNTDKGIYYYTTYENSCITAVNMHRENLDERKLIVYPMMDTPTIKYAEKS